MLCNAHFQIQKSQVLALPAPLADHNIIILAFF